MTIATMQMANVNAWAPVVAVLYAALVLSLPNIFAILWRLRSSERSGPVAGIIATAHGFRYFGSTLDGGTLAVTADDR